MEHCFLSCDWGTTNFRMRLVNSELKVIEEISSGNGVGELVKAWRAKNTQDEEARVSFYMDVLKEHAQQLQDRTSIPLKGIPLVISGMASSSIGLINLPYQSLPIPTDGSGLVTHTFGATDDFPHEVHIISGVQSDDDVMRGEETQLIGCLTPEMDRYEGPQLIIHPGTHSKHIMVEDGIVTDFKTFMSGEFFKLLSTHGILTDNVAESDWQDSMIPAFEQGVRDAFHSSLLHAAFKVRTNNLFGKLDKEQNYHYLSGLLIGTELRELNGPFPVKTFLCCGPGLIRQYTAALRVLKFEDRVTIFPAEWETTSVIRGHSRILKYMKAITPGR